MTTTNQQRPHVGIVGAGISGLRCADVLLSHGFRVTILEARSRIGGRICQSEELGYTVDIGPNWIHTWDSGAVHPIMKLAAETETPLHHWNEKQLIYDSAGNKLPDDKTNRLSTLLWEIIEKAFKTSAAAQEKDGGKSIPSGESLYDFISKSAAEELQDEEERRILVQMSEMWGAYVGEPVWKQSLRFAWMEECCGGEEVFVESNYSAILDSISKPAREHAEIVLNTKVNSIHAPSRDKLTEQSVTLRTEDGKEYTFDQVVMSTPLGWLQKNLDCFQPALPPRLTSAIHSLKLSQLEKVYITFPRAFWISDRTADSFPAYTNWLAPSYAADTNPRGWPQEIWNLASFAAPHDRPTILFYLYGDCSRHVVDAIHGKSRADRFAFLRAFFRPYYSRLPGFDDATCEPKAILATEWLRDDLCGNASYCNFQVGVEAADQDILALRTGCGDRGLRFCGEHAAPFEECGTVAGAYLSGQSAGEKLVALYGGGGGAAVTEGEANGGP
ncbi:FAD/NAD(P)-binding domain-containing protein [Hypoxylon rubiginosum]|uniref:FAD/NAD(P)-binding domain-containing protein n=1 Tax=Hypoxylon rubiginosum TaxID=110542 RepID=A0ACB9YTS1_9PEZI|nr:FAD/NAD(P)-binding domain-containing protein [Hypoxylon rubiginosum]